jgi:hypothetical protein
MKSLKTSWNTSYYSWIYIWIYLSSRMCSHGCISLCVLSVSNFHLWFMILYIIYYAIFTTHLHIVYDTIIWVPWKYFSRICYGILSGLTFCLELQVGNVTTKGYWPKYIYTFFGCLGFFISCYLCSSNVIKDISS